MQLPTLPKNNQGRLSKRQRVAYFQHMDSLISNLATEDQAKMEYVRGFLRKLPLPNINEGDSITIGPIDYRLFQYMLYWLILEYNSSSDRDKVKLQI